jgi:hypothetical protein
MAKFWMQAEEPSGNQISASFLHDSEGLVVEGCISANLGNQSNAGIYTRTPLL